MQYNSEEFIEILSIFKAESEEIIQELNDGFLELEKNPDNKAPLKKLFQLAHSLKGAARMIGFNGIQDISHKLEDILSYWKKDDVKIDIDSFQLIYRVCDFLSGLIVRAVEKKADIADKQVMTFINELDNFIICNKMIPVSKPAEKPGDYIKHKSMDINAVILELMFVLELDDKNEIIPVIAENLNRLLELFDNTDFQNIIDKIKKIIEYINIHNDDDIIDFCRAEIVSLRNDIYNIYKDLNINFSNVKIQKTEKEPEKNEIKQYEENKTDGIAEKFDILLKNLSKIKFEKNYIREVNAALKEIITLSGDKKIELIISKTINILGLFLQKDIVIDNDCYMVILQSIYLAKRMLLNEKEENLNNLNFLVQRLSVVEDMFNITGDEAMRIPAAAQNQSVQIQSGQDMEILKKNINSIELQEIKTLRVDTGKLDNLISQTGELLVNGIKTREHLIELAAINLKLIQWNSASKKIINYLKYLEKKGFFNSESDDSSLAFYKKAQAFFWNNAEMISDIQNDFGKLYNLISEDDNKLHQTAMEIESIAKGIRVLPLATIFHSFPRMIRDIAVENHKKIDFIVSGSDTTVDKKLIEEIKMPLIHILRNSVSHGIEIPEERLKNGKSETGTIRLVAKQAENNVIISIEDDGYGINLEKVKQTAIKKGLLFEEEIESMSNEQLMKLLFLPGFSTEDSITEISGRGIGLDIVKTKINNLNGDIFIDSVLNKGCRVTIKLPVSMSTVKTFIIMVNNQKYAIPVNSIKYVKLIKKNEIFNKNGKDCIIYDNHSIPIYSLSEIFGEKPDCIMNETQLTAIIIENQERQAAFITDKLLGDQEVFHKKLVPPIIKIRNISGVTTLSTGETCLIINPYELMRNTILNNYLPEYDVKNLLPDNIANTDTNKTVIVFDENELEFLANDLSSEFNSPVVFNNIYSVYDFIQKNRADAFICKLNNENSELLRLLKYIKSDEILASIKIIILSDLTEYDVINTLENYKPDLYIKLSDYNKDLFINSLKQKL